MQSCQLPVAGCQLEDARKSPRAGQWLHATRNPQPTTHNLQCATRNPRRAFSLTEILIVIALIVLMLAMALPAFNFISGSRSIEGAQNQVSAFLAQARADAVGLQEVRGVMFFIDPKTQRPNMAIVKETAAKNGDNANVQKYLDLVDGDEFVAMPKGVSIQTIDNGTVVGGARTSDGYIGFNSVTLGAVQSTPFGSAILFDGEGRLVSLKYGFRCSDNNNLTTAMGELLNSAWRKGNNDSATDFFVDNGNQFQSELGFVLFEDGPFHEQNFSNTDPQFSGGSYATTELGEETWLDNNSTPFYINRYNGTLVKGQ